ncbi:dihydrofolate reductase family protein [Mycobacterium tilburgii]|uniref:dihydrofolate reductase family protein n=1 Tax=Mycobacterium tilburgii TaxID=44467 RepID=UPI0021B285C7|nr:hypothetical protein [Mycobacterium tilburgii]
MRKIKAGLFVALDGVVEAPDQWYFPFNDETGAAVDATFSGADTMLFGRKTYDSFAGAWPAREGAEFAKQLGDVRKLLVSRQDLDFTWRNSEQLPATPTSPPNKRSTRKPATRSNEINAACTRIAKQVYCRELAHERSFGGTAANFTLSNNAKMTKADRAMFTASTALYPDEMVEHAASLGHMLARRSKGRAHYNARARQRTRLTRSEVFDLNDALQYGRFRFSHYIDSAYAAAFSKGSLRDRYSTAPVFVTRTPDNERRVRALVARYN